MHSDGDLWELFHRSIKGKHTKSLNITWTKGTAITKMVEQGITTHKNMTGNTTADEIADIGTELFSKEVVELAQKYHNRHNLYKNLMQKVITHTIEAYDP